MKKYLLLILVGALLLSGCNILEPVQTTAPTDPSTPTTVQPGPGYTPVQPDNSPVKVDFATDDDWMFTNADNDASYSESNSAVITLSGNAVSSNAKSVIISGTTATITRGGTYIIRGKLDNGMIIVNCPEEKPRLVLDGASITSATSAAIYVKDAKKVFLTLAPGKENSLSNGGSFVAIDENEIDGVVFSKQNLAINGTGSLTVTSPAGHGIVCKDNLMVTGGDLQVYAASHGLRTNESCRIKGGNVTIDAGKDGIHAEDKDDTSVGFVYISGGQLKIEAEGDGISAALHMQVSGGDINILAGGGYTNGASHDSGHFGDFMGGGGMMPPPPPRSSAVEDPAEDGTSMKGLKAGAGLLINGGTLTVDSADDAVHSDTLLVINGGTVQIDSGDDGLHADKDLYITAGTVTMSNCYEGLEAINVTIKGGDVSMVAADDGINAAGGNDETEAGGRDPKPGMSNGNGSVVISGGKLYIKASGDGVDANGYIKIVGGHTVICGPNRGDTATLDYDKYATITGGVFIGTGASGMAQTFSEGSQGVISVRTGAGQPAGVKVVVKDAQGNELLTHEPELDFSVFIFSAPELTRGEHYQLIIGDASNDVTAA